MSFLKNLRGPGGKPIDLSPQKAKPFRSGGSYAPVWSLPGNPDVPHRPMMKDITKSTAAKASRSAKSLAYFADSPAKTMRRGPGSFYYNTSHIKGINQFGSSGPSKAFRATAAKALRAPGIGSAAMKATATKGLGALAGPVAGAILGANELRKNVPTLVKGIPAYMKERKAAKDSASNLKTLRAQAAGKLKSK